MAQEDVLIKFEVDYSELTNAQQELSKTGKVDTKGFQAIQAAISDTATDTQGLIKQFKDVAGASVKMGKSIENAFGAGVEDALKDAGVSLNDFSKALTKANAPIKSVKTEMRELKEAMSRMKAEGKDTGREFDALRARAGKLQDAIGDANAEIKNAGSDTRHLDNVVGSISALAGGFAAAQGAVALFGDENQDLQKTLVKVTGAMALAQGLQQVYNATLKEGALTKLADSVATGAQSTATTLYTFVMGGATVATKLFRAALIATGIGAVVILVISLVSAISDFVSESKNATISAEDFNTALEEQNRLLKINIDAIDDAAKLEESRRRRKGNNIGALGEALEAIKVEENKLAKIKELDLQARKDANYNRLTENKDVIANLQLLATQVLAQENKVKLLKSNAIADQEDREQEAEIERLRKQGIFNKKKLDDLEKARLKEQAALRDYWKKYFAQLAIHMDNERDQINDHEQQKLDLAAKWDALRLEMQKSFIKSSQDAADKAAAAAAKKKIEDEDERVRLIEKKQLIISIAQELGGVFAELSRQQAQRDAMFIDGERKKVDEQLKAGAITAKAAEQKQKQFDELERKYRQKAATREKQAAVFQALLAVPQAYLQGVKSAPGPAGIALGAIGAAFAAIQAALIIARPIPKFFKGKKGNYEGPGIVGDAGAELVERGGRMFLYTKPSQTYLGKKDKVYTASETRNILHNTNISTTATPSRGDRFDYDRLAKAIPKNSFNINIDKEFITESVANGLSKTNYMDRRYSSK